MPPTSVPDAPSPARAVVVAANPRPLTRAVQIVDGLERLVEVPPHYAGYRTLPDDLVTATEAALGPQGYGAARFAPPLKTLAKTSVSIGSI